MAFRSERAGWRVRIDGGLRAACLGSLVLLVGAAFLACDDDGGPPPVATVSVSPATATLASVGETVQLTATALDRRDNPIAGATFTWTTGDAGVASVDTDGLVTAVGNGTVAITATADDVSGDASVTVDQVAVEIVFTVQPSNASAGDALAPAPEVEARDAMGNVATNATGSVDASVATGPGNLLGTTTEDFVNGVATFSDVRIETAGTGYTLSADYGLFTDTSDAFDITPAPPAQLSIRTEPSDNPARQAIAPAVEVEFLDAFGNFVDTVTADVTVALSVNPGSMIFHASGRNVSFVYELVDPVTPAVLPPAASAPVANIMGMEYEPATGMVLAAQNDFNVPQPWPNNLIRVDPYTGVETLIGTMSTWPPGPVLRAPAFESGTGRLLVAEHAASGNRLWDVDTNTGVPTVVGPVTVPGDNVLGFNALATDPTDGTLYAAATLASLGGPPSVFRALLRIPAGLLSGTIMGVLSQPGVSGLTFLPDGTLIAVVGDGGTSPETLWSVDKSTGLMTFIIALGNGDNGEAITRIPARLSGTLTVAAVNGVATFSDLEIDGPANGYQLVATATGMTDAQTVLFNITP
ncbi:MAG: Ig-like domain-containing protein [Gemmatimonadota bacterium]|nr:MAG: Ig-like domain-containing protein [Gemmatimonadota bacterium]